MNDRFIITVPVEVVQVWFLMHVRDVYKYDPVGVKDSNNAVATTVPNHTSKINANTAGHMVCAAITVQCATHPVKGTNALPPSRTGWVEIPGAYDGVGA